MTRLMFGGIGYYAGLWPAVMCSRTAELLTITWRSFNHMQRRDISQQRLASLLRRFQPMKGPRWPRA